VSVAGIILFRSEEQVFSHDEIANLLGVTSKSFEDTYEDKVKELKRTLLEYVKTLMAVTNSAGAGASAAPATGSILFDVDGFPIAPNNLLGKTTKEDLEQLYHAYITQHYREFLLPRAVSLLTFSDRTCLPR
jgi:hypothetical protein